MGFLTAGRASLTPEHLGQLMVLRDYARLPGYKFDAFFEHVKACQPDLEVLCNSTDSEVILDVAGDE